MAGGYRCSCGHDWIPPGVGPHPIECPVCGNTVVMADDPTDQGEPAYLDAVTAGSSDQIGQAVLHVPHAPGNGSQTVTLPPDVESVSPPASRDVASFSSLVGMPQAETANTNFDPGSVVPFGERTVDFTPPPSVPGYEILHEVGRGGMGVVYKARHVNLNRSVVLKMILAGSHAGPKERERFRREAEAVATLQNPHIVQIFEIGEASGHLYLALEFVDGGSLAQHLGGIPWAARDAAELVELLARAVQYAHNQGVVHRDLKPGNVLLGRASGGRPQGENGWSSESVSRRPANCLPKITDFGLAKCLGDSANPEGTKTGAVMGTPSYIAPEQASGKTARRRASG